MNETIHINKEETKIKRDLCLTVIIFSVLIVSYILLVLSVESIVPAGYMYVVDPILPYIIFLYFIAFCIGLFVIGFLVYLLLTKPYRKVV